MTPTRPGPPRLPDTTFGFSSRRVTRVLLLFVVVLVLVTHLPLRHSDYVQDDHLAVEENPIVSRGNIAEIFSTSYWAGARGNDRSLYRPVTVLTYAMERALVGRPDPLFSQVVNLLLHLATVLALYGLVARLAGVGLIAAATALIFSVHPIHVEAVANIVGRAELLAALFSFAGLAVLTLAGRWNASDPAKGVGSGGHRLAAWGAALLLFLALGAKEVALATPLLYAGLELLFRPGDRRRREFWIDRAAALAPSTLAALCYLGLRIRALESFAALQQPHPLDNPLILLDGAERVGTALGLVTRYLGLLFYPVGLAADYSGPVIDVESGLLAPRPLIGLLFLTGLVVLTLRPLLNTGKALASRCWAFAAILFLVPYLVVGNLLFSLGTIFAERVVYLPSAGFCFMLGLLLGAIAADVPRATMPRQPALSRRLAAAALAAMIAGFMGLSWARCHDWRHDESLFRAAARTRPASPRAHFIVGKLAGDHGDHEEALARFDRTLTLYPEHVSAWNEKGVVLGRMGQLDLAESAFREALRISPIHSDAHLNLGIALRGRKRLGEAERSLHRALLWDPESSTGWAELGNLLLQIGRFEPAAAAYRRAIQLGRADLRPRLEEAVRLSRDRSR